MKDNFRYNLVTNFSCTICGRQLMLTYDKPSNPKHEYDPMKQDGITGAYKVDNTIYIHPCETCFKEATAPIEALKSALGIKS